MIRLLQLTPYTGDIVAPSPNHDSRKAQAIEGIVLHATEDAGNEAWTASWLCSPRSRASCHLLVGRSGRVTRLVGDRDRAWHAGASQWRGKRDVNSITLGIEIANRNDGEPYTDAQYNRVAEIVAHYCRQGLSINDVVSHAEVAPGRKRDPYGWDWDRFRNAVQDELQPPEIAPASIPVIQRAPQAPAIHATKPILRSRTLWLNGLTVLAATAAIVSQALNLAVGVGLTVPERIMTWALFSIGLVNIILRFLTTKPICGCPADLPSTQPSTQTSAPQIPVTFRKDPVAAVTRSKRPQALRTA